MVPNFGLRFGVGGWVALRSSHPPPTQTRWVALGGWVGGLTTHQAVDSTFIVGDFSFLLGGETLGL